MYYYNDFEAWRVHRDELLQEAEVRRLARQLRGAIRRECSPDPALAAPALPGISPEGRKMAGC